MPIERSDHSTTLSVTVLSKSYNQLDDLRCLLHDFDPGVPGQQILRTSGGRLISAIWDT